MRAPPSRTFPVGYAAIPAKFCNPIQRTSARRFPYQKPGDIPPSTLLYFRVQGFPYPLGNVAIVYGAGRRLPFLKIEVLILLQGYFIGGRALVSSCGERLGKINVLHNMGLNVTSLLNEIKIKRISWTFLSGNLIGFGCEKDFLVVEVFVFGLKRAFSELYVADQGFNGPSVKIKLSINEYAALEVSVL